MVTTSLRISANKDAFSGLIDHASRCLADCGGEEITIDCSEIEVVNSYMLDRLIRLHLDASQRGARMVLVNVTDSVLEIIAVTRLDRMLRIRCDSAQTMPPNSHLNSRETPLWRKRVGAK